VIASLRIRNFKAYREQSFSLGRLNLLAGLNGSGKSSLLQTLLILKQSADQGLLESDEVTLNGSLVRLGRFKDVLFESAEDQRISIILTFASGNDLSCVMAGWSSEDRTGPATVSGEHIDGGALLTQGFRFLAAERIGPRTQYGVPDDSTEAGVGISGEWTPFYLAKHGDQNAPNPGSYHPGAVSPQLKHQIEAWMSEVSPGLQIHCDRADSMDAVQLSYSFVARHDTSSK